MFCHNCGAQIGEGIRFCPACGQPVAAASLSPGGASPSPWSPPVGIHTGTGRWIAEGWNMVTADLGSFALATLLFIVLNSMVPIIITGPLTAGFHIVCMKKALGKRTEFADLFTGFNFFVPTLVASLVISLFVFAGTLLCIIPGLVVAAMYKFTYLFIVDKRMDFWPAMQASHAVVKNDYFGFTMFLLALIGINILGALACLVGLLVTVPITFAAITVAYKEIVGFEPATVQSL